MNKITFQELQAFETEMAELFKDGKINCPVHLSGGNENQLISLFENINENDYVLSTHRNHYHYLLKTGNKDGLRDEILGRKTGVCNGKGRSMHIYDHKNRFYSSAIVAGMCGIACGLGLAIWNIKEKSHVWCFIGDGAEDTGHFMESVRFAQGRELPVTFIVEDNDLAVETTKEKRWKKYGAPASDYILRYSYERMYPHVGVGKNVSF